MNPRPESTPRGFAACLTPAEWAHLLTLGRPAHVARGDIMCRQGDGGQDILVIQSGHAKVTRVEIDGRLSTLALRGRGDVVGDMSALDGRPRSATVAALTSITAVRVRSDDFRRFVDRPSSALAFGRYTIGRLREADELRSELAVLPARPRLARALIRLSADASHTHRVVTVGQQDLADLIGTSRNTVSNELRSLRAAGIVRTTWRRIELIDPAMLARVASHHDRRFGRG